MTQPPPSSPMASDPPAPKRSWFSRNWGWVLGCGCLSVVMVGVLLFVLLVFGAASLGLGLLKESDAYKQALQRVKANPEASQLLGTPIEPGFAVTGNINVQNSTGTANLSFPVSGPKGEGTVTVRATHSGGAWTIQYLTLQVSGQPAPLVLIDTSSGTPPTGTLEAPDGGGVQPPATAPPDPQKAVQLHEQGVKEYAASIQDPKRRDGAIALLEQAVQNDPKNDVLKLDLADAYVQLNHEVAVAYAIDLFEDVLKRHPQDDAVIARLADAYGALGNYKYAFRFLERRMALPKPNVRGVGLQATTLAIDSHQLEHGQRLLTQLATRYPDEHGLRLLNATLLAEAGRLDEARALVRDTQRRIPPGDPMLAESQKMLERLMP